MNEQQKYQNAFVEFVKFQRPSPSSIGVLIIFLSQPNLLLPQHFILYHCCNINNTDSMSLSGAILLQNSSKLQSPHEPPNKSHPLHPTSEQNTLGTEKASPSPSRRLADGLSEIYNRLNLMDGYSDFVNSYIKLQIGPEEIKQLSQNKFPSPNGDSNENLNQTPFFGCDTSESPNISMKKPNNSQAASLLDRIGNKNNEALQQFSTNLNALGVNTSSEVFPSILQAVEMKMDEAFAQFSANFAQLRFQPDEIQSRTLSKQIDEDNEFMSEQFQTHHKLAPGLEPSSGDYIKQKNIKQQHTCRFAQKFKQIFLKYEFRQYTDFFAQFKQLNSHVKNEIRQKNEQDRAVSQKISSAQSQRIVSAEKYSENDESFNLDLTIKSKNFKNPYIISKADSLIYSVESGFFPSENQNKNQYSNSSKSVKQKMDEIEENRLEDESIKASLHKNQSERVEYKQKLPKEQRIVSSKIQQHHDHEYSGNQSNQNSSQIKKDKLQDNHVQKRKLNKKINKSQKDFDEKNSEDRHKKLGPISQASSKAKIPQSQIDQEQQSAKGETIINRVQNFDADDEDQEEKQLHQSAHFSQKRMNSEQRKRVETEVSKNKKQLKNQNYSIKNVKRFNKVDFTQLEQQNKRSVSQVISHNGSNSNIFSTEVENYQRKISRLRQEKEMKKKNLERELARVNHEIKMLNRKQEQLSPQNKNNFASRVKISDNNQAQKKAESLVKNLRSQKRNRNIAKVGQFVSLDRNINDYMQQLNKLRAENEEKLKQKKKLEILERMKQNEMRKLNEKKKITENQNFVLHLKGGNAVSVEPQLKHEQDKFDKLSKRSPTRQEQQIISSPQQSNLTPELSQKKAHLNKVRNFDAKKQHRDAYEQILG